MLACGCLVGLYETYKSETIAVIDAKGSTCHVDSHRVDEKITLGFPDKPAEDPKLRKRA
jgi:hypothetical protein